MFKQRGFTLIELLVVIAIIGLLASVVFASLGSARAKGVDAAVKANLANSRSQAELYADANGNSYSGVCGTTDATGGVHPINSFVLKAASETGLSAVNSTLATAGTGVTATCHDSITGWAAQAPLRDSTSAIPDLWCVDSTGASKQGGVIAISSVVCP